MFWSSRLSVVCQSRVRSRKLGEIGAKFRRLHRKSGSSSKNITSECTGSSPKPQNSPKYCAEPIVSLLQRCTLSDRCRILNTLLGLQQSFFIRYVSIALDHFSLLLRRPLTQLRVGRYTIFIPRPRIFFSTIHAVAVA